MSSSVSSPQRYIQPPIQQTMPPPRSLQVRCGSLDPKVQVCCVVSCPVLCVEMLGVAAVTSVEVLASNCLCPSTIAAAKDGYAVRYYGKDAEEIEMEWTNLLDHSWDSFEKCSPVTQMISIGSGLVCCPVLLGGEVVIWGIGSAIGCFYPGEVEEFVFSCFSGGRTLENDSATPPARIVGNIEQTRPHYQKKDDLPEEINLLIDFIYQKHPLVDTERYWTKIDPTDSTIPIDFFARRIEYDKIEDFVKILCKNTELCRGEIPEIRPFTAIGVICDLQGTPIGLASSLLGDAFHKLDDKGAPIPGTWSECGALIFPNNMHMLTASIRDMHSEAVPLTIMQGCGLNIDNFEKKLRERKGFPRDIEFVRSPEELQRQITEKAIGATTHSVESGNVSKDGMHVGQYGALPHNEVMSVPKLGSEVIYFDINTHSKKAIKWSLKSYQKFSEELTKYGKYKDVKLCLAVRDSHNVVWRVNPENIDDLYRSAPTNYSIDPFEIFCATNFFRKTHEN